MKEKEKCNKGYCLECRYHLEKENRWKNEKEALVKELEQLRQEVEGLRKTQKESVVRTSVSVMVESTPSPSKLSPDIQSQLT
jgi:hypothetical protein